MKNKNFEYLKKQIQYWASQRDLLHVENTQNQFKKFREESDEFKTELDFYSRIFPVFGEYGKDLMKMEMGDIFVTLIVLCEQLEIDPVECLSMAYDKISGRAGVTINGTFVKEEDLIDG